MINRKFYARLEKFHSDNGEYALLVDGARQVGKTFLIEEFAKPHYENVIEINFVKEPTARLIFQNIENEIDILKKLSAYSHKELRRGQTRGDCKTSGTTSAARASSAARRSGSPSSRP